MYITSEDVQTGNNCMKGHSLLVRGNGSQSSNEICYIVIKVAIVSPSSGNTEYWWEARGYHSPLSESRTSCWKTV